MRNRVNCEKLKAAGLNPDNSRSWYTVKVFFIFRSKKKAVISSARVRIRVKKATFDDFRNQGNRFVSVNRRTNSRI